MAGVDVGTAYLTVIPSARGFAGNLQRELGKGMTSAGKDAGEKASKGFSGAFKAGLGGFLAGLGFEKILSGTIGFLTDAVGGASDLEQSMGGVDAVFGKYATDVKKSSEAAAQSLGLSANSYNELVTVSGALLKNKGIKDFASQSEGLIKVGADLSAQFGGSTKDAVDALNAAMRGESDPIERYGISLSETAVNAELAARGQSKLKGAALEQAKTQARLAIITRQSADAQGAFGRESDTLAGKQQRLGATWENIKTTLGQALLPVLSTVAGVFNEKILPAITKFIEEFKNGEGAGGQFRDVLSSIATAAQSTAKFIADNAEVFKTLGIALLTGVSVFKTITTVARIYTGVQAALNVVLTANPIGIVVVAIAALAAGLIYAYQNSETFRNVVDTAFKAIGAAAGFMWHNIVAPIIGKLVTGFATVVDGIGNFLDALSNIPGFGWAKDAANKMHGAAAKAQELADKINGIPDQKNIKVRTEFVTVGTPPPLPLNSPAFFTSKWLKPDGARATGGPVSAGRSYLVGEHEPELFVPNTSGRIMNQSQIAAANDPQVLARAIASEMVRAFGKMPPPQVSVGQIDSALGWRA